MYEAGSRIAGSADVLLTVHGGVAGFFDSGDGVSYCGEGAALNRYPVGCRSEMSSPRPPQVIRPAVAVPDLSDVTVPFRAAAHNLARRTS